VGEGRVRCACGRYSLTSGTPYIGDGLDHHRDRCERPWLYEQRPGLTVSDCCWCGEPGPPTMTGWVIDAMGKALCPRCFDDPGWRFRGVPAPTSVVE